MEIGNYAIADLQQVVREKMVGVSANIFTSRPTTVPTSMSDFILIQFLSPIADLLAYGRTSCRISVYARDVILNSINYENTTKLKTMQTAVYQRLPITDSKYLIDRPRPVNGGSDKLGFHYYSIQLDVTIK